MRIEGCLCEKEWSMCRDHTVIPCMLHRIVYWVFLFLISTCWNISDFFHLAQLFFLSEVKTIQTNNVSGRLYSVYDTRNFSQPLEKTTKVRVFQSFFCFFSENFQVPYDELIFLKHFFWDGWFLISYFENTRRQRHLVANTPNSVMYLPSTKAKKANESVFSSRFSSTSRKLPVYFRIVSLLLEKTRFLMWADSKTHAVA